MSFAELVLHRLHKPFQMQTECVQFNWVTHSKTNIWHFHPQQKTGPWFFQALTDRTNHSDMATVQTSCDCRRAIRASREDTIPLWLSSIIPPSRKAHSSCCGHVLRGECWQFKSSVRITQSQTSWKKRCDKGACGNGTGNATCTYTWKSHETGPCSREHVFTPPLRVLNTPLMCTEANNCLKGEIEAKKLDLNYKLFCKCVLGGWKGTVYWPRQKDPTLGSQNPPAQC